MAFIEGPYAILELLDRKPDTEHKPLQLEPSETIFDDCPKPDEPQRGLWA